MSDAAPQRLPAPPGGGGEENRPLQVSPERLLQDWKEAHRRVHLYLLACGVAPAECEALAQRAIAAALDEPQWPAGSDAVRETLGAARRLLAETPPASFAGGGAPDGSGARTVELASGDTFARAALGAWIARAGATPPPETPFAATPRLARGRMVPEQMERRFIRRHVKRLLRRRIAPAALQRGRERRRRLPWLGIARRRRMLLSVLVLIPSIVASGFMVNVLPHKGGTALEVVIVLFFGALFGWISIGFWTALLGFVTLAAGGDRFRITALTQIADEPPPPESSEDPAETEDLVPGPKPPPEVEVTARTAVVMPIAEEPVDRVFAGLRAIYNSLARTGALAHFDFFVLSDSNNPDTWVREEEAWARWCRDVNGFGKIFYRRRRVRLERKAGNVADFCRRWGRHYRYMIMLDADSIMSGESLVRLVQMMERHPDAGMIQTAPVAVNRRSLLARIQQFSGRVYGPMFAAGLHFWQLGDGQYWGHNTIIRIAPFMDHCALPRLPGKPPLGGEILSHDFVEAALMGRAGWTLWLAFDLGGSYEEVPSTLLEEMKRDRRWCQGNLQHLRLLFSEGLFGAHRALFLNGALSYVSAGLWFCFLGLSTAEAIADAMREPDYFPHGASLFPEWPVWRPDWALALLAVTGLILFLPKLLSVLLIALNGQLRFYGGLFRLTLSVLLEILFSSLSAPIRMVFHTRFVLANLLGRTVTWRSQNREDNQTGWREATRHHGLDSLFASAWALALYWLNPDYFWWVTPIVIALILAVPLSVLTSRVSLGDGMRRAGLFLIPEEAEAPQELIDLQENLRRADAEEAGTPPPERDGYVRAAVDPCVSALRTALARGLRRLRPSIRAKRWALLERAAAEGSAALNPRERAILLSDPECTAELHRRVWSLSEQHAAAWGVDRPRTTQIDSDQNDLG